MAPRQCWHRGKSGDGDGGSPTALRIAWLVLIESPIRLRVTERLGARVRTPDGLAPLLWLERAGHLP